MLPLAEFVDQSEPHRVRQISILVRYLSTLNVPCYALPVILTLYISLTSYDILSQEEQTKTDCALKYSAV